jgi:hypothetical protein
VYKKISNKITAEIIDKVNTQLDEWFGAEIIEEIG